MTIHRPIPHTKYQDELQRAHRERQARFAAAACRFHQRAADARTAETSPLWKTARLHFDQHVKDWRFQIANRGLPAEMVYLRKRAAELQVPVADIVGRSVEKKLTKIRRLLIAEIRENFGLSLREMGRLFGGRDQKAIAYAIQCHEAEQAIAR